MIRLFISGRTEKCIHECSPSLVFSLPASEPTPAHKISCARNLNIILYSLLSLTFYTYQVRKSSNSYSYPASPLTFHASFGQVLESHLCSPRLFMQLVQPYLDSSHYSDPALPC